MKGLFGILLALGIVVVGLLAIYWVMVVIGPLDQVAVLW